MTPLIFLVHFRRFNPQDALFFPDFNDQELMKILKDRLRKENLTMTYDTRTRFIEMLASERKKPKFGNAGSLNNLLSRAMSSMSARDPTSRKVTIDDLGLSAKEAAAGGDPMDELRGMYKIDNIVRKLNEIKAVIQSKRRKGEEITVDNFLFLGNPGYVCSPNFIDRTLGSDYMPNALQDRKDGRRKDDAKDDVEARAAGG